MTILEFKGTNPSDYGVGNVNLLYSGSIGSGHYELPSSRYPNVVYDSSSIDSNGDTVYYKANAFFPPYIIIGLTIPFTSTNGVSLEQTLNQVTSIKFTLGAASVTTPVINISKQNQYFYLETDPTTVFTLPPEDDTQGTPLDIEVEFIFLPYIKEKFDNSDFNALQGNATGILKSKAALEVDRDTDNVNPSNLAAIITRTAQPAQIQYSNYTTRGWTNARYEGSKNVAVIPRDNPAQSYKSFVGSIHPMDADDATILSSGQSDQNTKKLYFNVEETPILFSQTSSLGAWEMVRDRPYDIAGSFPTVKRTLTNASASLARRVVASGSIIYESEGNDFIRVVNKKIHATDKGSIFITDELGIIYYSASS